MWNTKFFVAVVYLKRNNMNIQNTRNLVQPVQLENWRTKLQLYEYSWLKVKKKYKIDLCALCYSDATGLFTSWKRFTKFKSTTSASLYRFWWLSVKQFTVKLAETMTSAVNSVMRAIFR